MSSDDLTFLNDLDRALLLMAPHIYVVGDLPTQKGTIGIQHRPPTASTAIIAWATGIIATGTVTSQLTLTVRDGVLWTLATDSSRLCRTVLRKRVSALYAHAPLGKYGLLVTSIEYLYSRECQAHDAERNLSGDGGATAKRHYHHLYLISRWLLNQGVNGRTPCHPSAIAYVPNKQPKCL